MPRERWDCPVLAAISAGKGAFRRVRALQLEHGMKSRGRRLLIGSLVLLAAALSEGQGRACVTLCPGILSPPYADLPVFPRNHVMFLADDRANAESIAAFKIAILAVGSDQSFPVSIQQTSSGEKVLAPDQPLPLGQTFQLSFDRRCTPDTAPPDDRAALAKVAFRTVDPETAPITYTGLRLVASGLVNSDPERLGRRNAYVTLEIDGDGSVGRSLTSHTVEVDGVLFRTLALGSEPRVTIEGTCGSSPGLSSCGFYDGVRPGRHVIKVTPHVLGAAVPHPPLSLEVDLTCGQEAGDNPQGTGLGGGGCSFAGFQPSPASLIVLLAGLLAGWLTRGTPPRRGASHKAPKS
jgi:hypothetical protein